MLLLIVDGLMVLTIIVSPAIFKNAMFVAVSWPLVFEVNVLMVEPVAVEKNKFCATKLFATYISRLTLIIGVEILIWVGALIYRRPGVWSVDTFTVLAVMTFPPKLSVVNPPVVVVSVVMVPPDAFTNVILGTNKFAFMFT